MDAEALNRVARHRELTDFYFPSCSFGNNAIVKQDLKGFLENVAAGRGPQLVLIIGDDLQVANSCRAIVDRLVPAENRGFNLEHFDGGASSWEQIEASLMTPPFLPGKKVLWVESVPYFYSREQKGELSEKVMELWRDGKRDEAAKRLVDLLAVQGWTQEQWDSLSSLAADAFLAALGHDSGEDPEEAQALLAFCKAQHLDLSKRKAAEGNRLNTLLDQGLPDWSFLLLTAAQVDRRTRLFKRFEEIGAVVDVAVERDRTGRIAREYLTEFIGRELRRFGKSLAPGARELFLERSGDELRGVQQELEKLVLFVGERQTIEREDVARIIADCGEGWIFDLTRALGERDALAALGHLNRLISQGDHPLRILATMAAEVRRLISARQLLDGELANIWRRGITFTQFQQKMLNKGGAPLGRTLFGHYLCLQRAEHFSLAELTGFMHAVFETDIRLKSSPADPHILLEKLFLDLCLRRSSMRDAAAGVAR